MDFLEYAVTLIPALTGVPANIYSGNPDVLYHFEQEYCFSAQLQRIYTLTGLQKALEEGADDLIYDVEEPLGSRLVVFRCMERWVLLGPYVEDGWNREAARIRLARAGASESAIMPFKAYRCKLPIVQRDRLLEAAQLTAGQTDEGVYRNIQMILARAGSFDVLDYPSDYEDSAVVNRRYAIEDRFMEAVSQGDWENAHDAISKIMKVTSDIRFVSDELRDQIAVGAIMRTIVRIGAKNAGLSPVLIDSISQEYAQKMQHANSGKEISSLMNQVTERFCNEVQKQRSSRYSACVRLAMDYISANLSRQLTSAEIAAAAGVERHFLTRVFAKETGMTVKRYLAVQRCEIAAKLLRNSEISVQEIAAYVGYPDNNYFSKVFKSNQGVSPQSYRWSCQNSKK